MEGFFREDKAASEGGAGRKDQQISSGLQRQEAVQKGIASCSIGSGCMVVLLWWLSLPGSAQGALGVQVGGNFSYLYVADPFRVVLFRGRGLLSPQIGGVYRRHVTDYAALQTGLTWAARGYVEELTTSRTTTAEVVSRMEYIEWPLTTVLGWSIASVRLSVEGGVFYRYLTKRSNKQRGKLTTAGEHLWALPASRYNLHGYGLHGGAGVGYRLGGTTVQAVVRVVFPLAQHIRSDRLYQSEPHESRLISYEVTLYLLQATKSAAKMSRL